jgi:hypothetical protein
LPPGLTPLPGCSRFEPGYATDVTLKSSTSKSIYLSCFVPPDYANGDTFEDYVKILFDTWEEVPAEQSLMSLRRCQALLVEVTKTNMED